ncbi:MAG: DUF456 domain-containing protein [bacterium]
MSILLLWLIVAFLFITGLAGIFIPILPGVGLVFLGILIYAVATNFASISTATIIIFGVVAILAWLIEYIGAAIGVRAGGGGKFAMIGLIIGALLGFISAGPVGILAGMLLGSFLGATYEGSSTNKASRAALFSVLGLLGAKVLQLLLAVGIIVAFLAAVLIN